jgi:hypothetical protein
VVVVKVALTDSGPLNYEAVRYVLGGLALYRLARGHEGLLVLLRGQDALLIAAAALSGGVIKQASFTVALSLTNPYNVAMSSGITPLLAAGWIPWRGGEQFRPRCGAVSSSGPSTSRMSEDRAREPGRAGGPREPAQLGYLLALAPLFLVSRFLETLNIGRSALALRGIWADDCETTCQARVQSGAIGNSFR